MPTDNIYSALEDISAVIASIDSCANHRNLNEKQIKTACNNWLVILQSVRENLKQHAQTQTTI